ncbi:NifU family protein [Planktosalinus lacus]|uniref:NifU family protein n=1 Tax=Planktosalinus lacus TaxID=1526573 RepID=A0A8J2V7S6_9FLAO|nr:NifU family protein [Planktosalinus lacus]GGD83293.1 NifU family protein [Planktosalinus lacus]
MSIFNIKIDSTSNPEIKKFVANQFLTSNNSYEFKNIDEAKSSPLAQQLFYLPFVKTIYIAQNFIAIEKFSIVEWPDVENEVAEQIENYLNSGEILVKEAPSAKKVPVTVYAESTPNPAVLKFVANKPLVDGTFEFKNIDEATHAPLAQALFHFSFVKEVFISANYISVTKYDLVEWQEVSLELREFIRKYIEEGKEILKNELLTQTKKEPSKPDVPEVPLDDYSKQIVSILNEYVKPAVASDGGNIAFESFDQHTKTVKVILQGACSGCPSSTVTLKNGIETMLKDMLNDDALKVEAING